MTHPSIQGLREAMRASREEHRTVARDRADVTDACVCGWEGLDFFFGHLEDLREQAQAAYLTEHGVLLSGEGLVREVGQATRTTAYIGRRYDRWELTILPDSGIDRVVGLVPVPQDGGL